ncbi:hypothetical protein VPNG_10161 [Cytospora leucostoma]|uniref:Myb-like domain-containing protein n=1 Tax=Cytospora leucostoma TaxID=1230097 RepID=A0A423VF77_9PEZI|nr:hypothetical protein VPNG_10161 [Cytospora leucostoma]
MSSLNPSIRGKKGERVAFSDCKLEPLNLLIPGGAPILVPKHKAWPGQKKRESTLVRVPLSAKDSYDATEEDKDLGERPASKLKSRKISQAVAKAEKKADGSCRKDTKKPKKANTEGGDRKKLEKRIKEQEDYIAKLKAKYAGSKITGAKARDEAKPESDTAVTTSSDDDDGRSRSSSAEATDGSEKVREMLSSLKIKAAGADADPFTPSEDAQILARKEAGESFRTIAEHMKRPRKQVSKRYNELLEAGKTVDTVCSGGDGEGGAATDAATAGESTGGAATEGEETGGESGDAPVADGDFGGLFDLGELATRLEAVVAEQDGTDDKEESTEDKNKKKKKDKDKDKKKKQEASPSSKKPKASKKGKDRNPTETLAGGNPKGGESGYESGSEAIPEDIGTRLYINQYAKRLLRDKDAIPEADERFDEDDCILLALAEGQHRHGRWEQIQARFANLTGRMVPLEVLKYKFGEAEKPEDY